MHIKVCADYFTKLYDMSIVIKQKDILNSCYAVDYNRILCKI